MKIHPSLKRTFLFRLSLLFCLVGTALTTLSQSDLRYQDRGDRHEGIDRGMPVSDRVELISATVNHSENLRQIPDEYKLKFYLSQQAPVFVRVREIDNRHNYWMDRLTPTTAWHQGFNNDFRWRTDDVIKRKQLKLNDLGAVAQLDSNDPSLSMRVAPVILFSSQPPSRISGYSFAFKISRRASVTSSISKDEDNSPILFTQSFDMVGQRPRTVSWNASRAGEGWYRLTISVLYSGNNRQVTQVIHFYHRPNVG